MVEQITPIVDVVIIGSGFSGQAAAVNLQKNGIENYIILERRPFLGGTWSQNIYPGAAVDIQSPLYSLSFEPFQWSQMFADQKELQEYTQHILQKYKLVDKAIINTEVKQIKWNEQEKLWEISPKNKGIFKARFVINASGPLSTPKIPTFKGQDSFRGVSFHTNAWDKNFDYKNKRIAIIGTGASAAQVIPTIAPDIKQLYVFQRTPHWVLPRRDYTFNKIEKKLLNIKPVYNFLRSGIYLSLESRLIAFKYSSKMLEIFAQKKALNHLEKQVTDPAIRRKLTPNFKIGCKRIILSNTLYPALNRKNVILLDKDQAISEITENGLKTIDGQYIELDAIIYATGYDAADNPINYDIIGKNNLAMSDVWSELAHAYLGTMVPKFPNLFLTAGPNTGIGHTSALFVIESQMQYVMNCIKQVLGTGKKAIEPTIEAETKYTQRIHTEMKKTVWHQGGCTSRYKNKNGYVISLYPGFSFNFWNAARKLNLKHHLMT